MDSDVNSFEMSAIEQKIDIKLENGFENNPWSVEDASVFLKYCCPECDYQILNIQLFSDHALKNHTKAVALFGNGENIEEIFIKQEYLEIESKVYDEEMQTDDFPFYPESEQDQKPIGINKKLKSKKTSQKQKKALICKICSKKISCLSNFNKHMLRMHKDSIENIEICDLCFVECSSKQILRKHRIKNHLSGKYSCCMYCDFKTVGSGGVKSHIDKIHPEHGEKKHLCVECGKGFIFKSSCTRHFKCQHQEKATCKICSLEVSNSEALKIHMKRIHEEKDKVIKCKLCFLEFFSKGSFKLHTEEKHQDGKQKCCCHCDYKDSQWFNVRIHIDLCHPEHGETKYFCELCGKGFIFEDVCRNHEKHRHSTNLCTICKKDCLTKDGLKEHFLQEHKANMIKTEDIREKLMNYDCHICFVKCSSEGMVKKHIREEHQVGYLKKCLYCDYNSNGWQVVKYHIDFRHSEKGEKKHFCDICGEGYIYEDSVEIHKKTKHQQSKVCQYCGVEYKYKQNLKDHIFEKHKNETDSIDLVCEICAFSTPSKKKLQQHIRLKHDIDKHEKCPHCDYHSADKKHMHVHIDSKHPEHDKKTFFCDHCSRSFIFEDSLKKHLENQRTMAANRAKKLNQGLMQRNRSKKYEDH